MDFNQVRYFIALSKTLNFTHAAELCYVSQPALTQAIKRLEVELDGDLLKRDGRNTELTELGSLLLANFEKLDEIKNIVKTNAKAYASGEIAELNIGIMCTIGPKVLSGFIEKFKKNNPMISLNLYDVDPDDIADKLISGEFHGVFGARHQAQHPELLYTKLFDEEMVIAFHHEHRFANLINVSLREIATEAYIDRTTCEFRDEFAKLFEEERLELNVVCRSQRDDWIQTMVRDNVGVSLTPRYSITQSELCFRSISEPKLSRQVEFCFLKNVPPSLALDMLNCQIKNHDW